MKPLLIGVFMSFTIGLGFSSPANSEQCADCKKEVSEQPSSGQFKDIEKIAKSDKNKPYRKLASTICGILTTSGLSIANDTKAAINRHMSRYESNSNPTGTQMLQFLNRNRHKMTCKDRDGIVKNYMKYAFDRRAHSLLFEELFMGDLAPDDLSVEINLNAISNTGPGGTPETVLDYMNNIIKKNTYGSAMSKDVESLRDLFVEEMGAKQYKQLTQAEKQAAM